jgi:hypothetical protein
MKVKDLFILHQGNGLELMHIGSVEKSDINFVAWTAQNNGVAAQVEKVEDIEPFPAGYITVALGGSVLSSFVQVKPFYTAFHIMALESKKELSMQEKLYYCMCIKANAYRYSYGRQANKTLKDIELPDAVPKWVNAVSVESIKTSIKKSAIVLRPIRKWKEFKLEEIFTITGTKTTKTGVLNEYGEGEYPYVTTQSTNNAVERYYNFYTENGNVLAIDSAVLGFCSYQAKNFSASDHVEKLTPKFVMNKYIALFLVTIINQEQYKYSYGRKCNQTKIKDTIIKLPVTAQGAPDWGYMEQYIKSLPYSDII